MTAVPAPGEPPEAPEDADDEIRPGLESSRYSKSLDAWLERWKEERARENTAEKLTADAAVVQLALSNARADTDRATEAALFSAVHAAYIATSQSSLDRAVTRMNVVTAAVGSIMTVYTGLLAYVYSSDPTKGRKLDIVAFHPAIFLGLSLFLVAVYAAMFRNKREDGVLLPSATGGLKNEERLTTYMEWCFKGVLARRWALHAGIVSLGLGVATLPVAFIDIADGAAWAIFFIGLLAVLTTAVTTAMRSYDI